MADMDDPNFEIVCGEWWEDRWISPYVRCRFLVGRGPKTLHVVFLLPKRYPQTPSISIRSGVSLVGVTHPIPLEKPVALALPLTGMEDQTEINISLRSDKMWHPGGDDTRALGVVVPEWRITLDEAGRGGWWRRSSPHIPWVARLWDRG